VLDGLSKEEVELLTTLTKSGVRFMIVGMSSAILQSAPGVTQDIDLWFDQGQTDRLAAACRQVGATYYWRTHPPEIGGPGLDQIDVVWNCSGLKSFAEEYEGAVAVEVAPGLVVCALPLERILASKRAAGRPKDKAAIPMLRDAIRTLKGFKP
jgi:hypothetical protein